MTKEEWKHWFTVFDEIDSEYLLAEQEYKKGKNKGIRESASRTMYTLRGRARNYIEDNVELLELVEFPDEMFTPSWFEGDLQKLIGRIKEKCNNDNS